MFAERMLFMIVAFFVGIYVARYLGPGKYGILNYALSFAFLFQAFSKLGLDGIVTRNLIQNPDKKLEILGSSFTLKVLGSIFSFILIFVSLQFSSSDYQTKIMVIIIAAGMLFDSLEVGRFFFESQVKAKYSAVASSVSVIVSSALKILFIFLVADLLWFAVAYSVEIVVRGVGFLIIYQKKNQNISKWKFDKPISKSLLKDSWPLMLSSMAVMLYMRIDQIMIKEMLDANAVGQYAAAVKISEIWYFIPVIINNSIFPAIIGAKTKNETFYYKRLQQLLSLLIWMALLISLPIYIISPAIITNLFGDEYLLASSVLSIHIWSGIFIFMNNTAGKWHIAENLTKLSLIKTILGATINITLNIILIPKYGIIGAAWATLITYAFIGYFSNLLFKPTRKLFKIQTNAVFFTQFFKP
ncbi:MAG: flippase [Bacteroidota bacterium]